MRDIDYRVDKRLERIESRLEELDNENKDLFQLLNNALSRISKLENLNKGLELSPDLDLIRMRLADEFSKVLDNPSPDSEYYNEEDSYHHFKS